MYIDDYGILRRPSQSSAIQVAAEHEAYSVPYRDSSGSIPHATGSSILDTSDIYTNGESSTWEGQIRPNSRRNTDMRREIAHFELHQNTLLDEDELYEIDARRFINLSLLSNTAVQLKDKVPRAVHVKEGISYPRAFTGKDIVVRSTLDSAFTCCYSL